MSWWESPSPRLARVFFYVYFWSDTPFILLAKLKIKEDKAAEYLEIADKTGKSVEALNVEIYETVGKKVIDTMNEKVVPYKIFKTN